MPSHFPSFLASHWSIPTWFWVIQATGKEMVQICFILTQEHDSEAIEAPGGNGAFTSLSDTSAPEHHRPEDLRPGKKSRLNWPLGDQLILPSLLRQPSVLSLPATKWVPEGGVLMYFPKSSRNQMFSSFLLFFFFGVRLWLHMLLPSTTKLLKKSQQNVPHS